MNYIWSGMIIIGLIFSFINGSCADFTDGLVPMSIIKIRQDLGSCDSGEIIIPSVIAGIISMSVSILVCKYFEGRNPNL